MSPVLISTSGAYSYLSIYGKTEYTRVHYPQKVSAGVNAVKKGNGICIRDGRLPEQQKLG